MFQPHLAQALGYYQWVISLILSAIVLTALTGNQWTNMLGS